MKDKTKVIEVVLVWQGQQWNWSHGDGDFEELGPRRHTKKAAREYVASRIEKKFNEPRKFRISWN